VQDQDVVLHVLADLGRVHPHGNVDRTQLLLVADAAEHEELWGVEPTRREDDLAVCPEGLALAVPHAVHAHGMVPLQEDAVDLGVDQDRDVLPHEDGVEEGARAMLWRRPSLMI
jgi:hypothetical protein